MALDNRTVDGDPGRAHVVGREAGLDELGEDPVEVGRQVAAAVVAWQNFTSGLVGPRSWSLGARSPGPDVAIVVLHGLRARSLPVARLRPY